MEIYTLLLLLGISIIACIFLVFFAVKSKKQINQLAQKNKTNEANLQQLNSSKENLINELQALKDKLNQINEDPLTHVLGWPFFSDRVINSIHESTRYQLTMAILYVDIKDFNVINNALGHDIGDAALQEVAKRLQTCIRQIDSISRFTKDIFVILLNRLNKPETAVIVAQRILQSMEQPIEVNHQIFAMGVCIGISIFPDDGQDVATLFRNAENALQTAKQKGPQNYQFYQEKIHIDSQRELALSTGLQAESVTNEFVITYQSIMNVKDNTILCAEALLQWNHAELGLIDPKELFNYAEKHGKLNDISEWLLKNACQQFLRWRDEGFHPQYLSVHLSIRQLENSHFIYRISQILQELKFNPEWLLLEMRESDYPISFSHIEKSYNMLKYLNVKLAIDDFGSHSLSIRDLKSFTVDYLKLDSVLIQDIDTNQDTKSLIKAISGMANSLNMQLILQGVVSEAQKTTLQGIGCYLMQGQWIDASLSENKFIMTDSINSGT